MGDGDRPHKVLCRLWWPRFTAEIHRRTFETRAMMEPVYWIDDPGERRDAILDAACEVFLLQRGRPSEATTSTPSEAPDR
jgi:hypothetical protein